MKSYSIKEDGAAFDGVRTFTIEGDITLANSGALKKELLATIGSCGDVHVVAKTLTGIDVSGLQLLVALKKQLLLNGVRAKFELELPADLHSLVERAGFLAVL